MKKLDKSESDAFLSGIACGLATMNRAFDQPTAVNCTLDGLGLTLLELKAAGVDDYDLAEIRKCLEQGNKDQRAQVAHTHS